MRTFALLAIVVIFTACSTESIDNNDDSSTINSENSFSTQSCTDELPKIRLVNNSDLDIDLTVYATDYSILYSEISVGDTDLIELPVGDVIISTLDDVTYGQKLPVTLNTCDVHEFIFSEDYVLSVATGGGN